MAFLVFGVFLGTNNNRHSRLKRRAYRDQVKARAAVKGTTIKALLHRYIENGLRQAEEPSSVPRQRSKLPVIKRRGKSVIPNLTRELRARLEEDEDLANSADLLDANVWLALAAEAHSHHEPARAYWEKRAAPVAAFCRITQMTFLRLLTDKS